MASSTDTLDRPAMTVAEFTTRLHKVGRDPETVMAAAPASAIRSLLRGQPVKAGLSRTVSERVAAVDDGGGDGLTIEGHWTVFNDLTEINSWEGSFTEQVLPGATKKTLRDSMPKMQFDHGYHPLLGSLPLGSWTEAHEDDHGSWSRGRMRSNWLVEPFADAIRSGDVTGMSFRFAVVKERWYDADGTEIKDQVELFNMMFWGEQPERQPLRRDLVEVNVSEAGPVVWPAYKSTDVGARSADGSRVVIDLAALATARRADAGHVIALIDAELSRADRAARGAPVPTDERRAQWQAVGRAGLEAMATNAVTMRQNAVVDTATAVHTSEPRTTDTAADHSTRDGEPGSTAQSAGEHLRSGQGDTARPAANPVERRESIRARYRDVLGSVLALPPTP